VSGIPYSRSFASSSIALGHDVRVSLVWVTGVSGCGKSSVCEVLKAQGRIAIDADWEGFSRWVHRASREPVVDPPDPVPAGWLNEYGWEIRPESVHALAARPDPGVCYLCGGFENEARIWQLFHRLVYLVVDEETLRDRLTHRTTNHFGRHPEELHAAFTWRLVAEDRFRRRGAAIIDATQPLDLVVAQVIEAAEP
jgi:gluconate kinase